MELLFGLELSDAWELEDDPDTGLDRLRLGVVLFDRRFEQLLEKAFEEQRDLFHYYV